MKQMLCFLIDLAPLIQAVFAVLVFCFIVKQYGISRAQKDISAKQAVLSEISIYSAEGSSLMRDEAWFAQECSALKRELIKLEPPENQKMLLNRRIEKVRRRFAELEEEVQGVRDNIKKAEYRLRTMSS